MVWHSHCQCWNLDSLPQSVVSCFILSAQILVYLCYYWHRRVDYATSSTHRHFIHVNDVCSMVFFSSILRCVRRQQQWMSSSESSSAMVASSNSLYTDVHDTTSFGTKTSWMQLKKENGYKHANWNCHWSGGFKYLFNRFFSTLIEFLYPFLNERLKQQLNIVFVFFRSLVFYPFRQQKKNITRFNCRFN